MPTEPGDMDGGPRGRGDLYTGPNGQPMYTLPDPAGTREEQIARINKERKVWHERYRDASVPVQLELSGVSGDWEPIKRTPEQRSEEFLRWFDGVCGIELGEWQKAHIRGWFEVDAKQRARYVGDPGSAHAVVEESRRKCGEHLWTSGYVDGKPFFPERCHRCGVERPQTPGDSED